MASHKKVEVSTEDLQRCIASLTSIREDPEVNNALSRLTNDVLLASLGRTCDECYSLVTTASTINTQIDSLVARSIDLLSNTQANFVKADLRLAATIRN
ncbi:MAG: hypothetical protein LBG97_04980 [Coriobacteriales bacterium]|jgi:hypothetical protein|nr:hypothetical protein [Coriobacteriales bacterium]